MKHVPRLIALLSFHNEMEFLPGYLCNVAAQVDGIVALDDGSTDGSGDFVAGHSAVLELVRVAPRVPHIWDESKYRGGLIAAAAKHEPDWLIGLDADERLEKDFRARSVTEIERAERDGVLAMSVYIRELWNSPVQYRSDGHWGSKRHARLFRQREDAEIDPKTIHGHWAPLNSKTNGGYPPGDLNVYHLRMIDAARRRARRERHELMDPERRLQPIGYAHLTDETGLELSPLSVGREYEPLP